MKNTAGGSTAGGSKEIWSSERVKELTMSRIELRTDTRKRAQNQHKRRHVIKAIASLSAAAAVICLMVFGNMRTAPQAENAFSLKAYAMEHNADGTATMREVDLLGETHSWFSHYDGKELYLSINLKCEGENIERVDFYTDDGFFARQYLKIENGVIIFEDGVPSGGTTDADGHTTIFHYGHDFERIGNSFTLSKGDMTDDLLLFLGMEIETEGLRDSSRNHIPPSINIRAVATFLDGSSQEETLTLDFSAESEGIGIFVSPPLTNEEYIQHILEFYDMDKIAGAFAAEAKNEGFGEVIVNSVDINTEDGYMGKGIWRVNYDVLPEGSTQWLTSQSGDVSLSILGNIYTIRILTEDEYAAIGRGEVPERLLRGLPEYAEMESEDGARIELFAPAQAELPPEE